MVVDIPDNIDLKFQEEADPKVLSSLDKIGQALVMIFNQVRSFKINWPKIFNVQGNVDVNSILDLPPVYIKNFKDLRPYFEMSEKAIKQLAVAITLISSKDSYGNRPMSIPAPVVNFDSKSILTSLESLKDSLKPTENKNELNMLRNISEGIGALYEKPTFVPPAVTNVNINPLQGFVHTTSATVGTNITKLPSYGQLFNRRSIIIYNNSANTIYLGGSDVTTSNGMPVPANSYSPILDAGYNMTIYGISSTGSNNVRCLEVSKDQTQNVQE
jgi:hypothetical protein